MNEPYTLPPGAQVLVTGASGFTGQVLVRQLLQAGVRVRAIARPSSRLEGFAGAAVEWIRGDVFDPSVVRSAIPGVEYLFHVAAAYREPQITDQVYERVHVASTQELALALVGRPEFKRFVHVSTVGVHGHIDDPPADETYRFSPGDVYQRTKAAAEVWLTQFARERGLPHTVVRPAAIYGPGDRRLLKIFKLAQRPFFPLFGSGAGLYHLIHVEDLARILIVAAVHPRAQGEVFIAGAPEPTRLEEMVRIIASELGNSEIRCVRFPAWPLFLAADICEAVCKPLGIAPPLYRRRVAFFTKDRAFDTSKLHAQLNFSANWSVEQGLRSTAAWYRSHGWLGLRG
jgi:nucleoside-diphosphate-sugar epimerase